MLNEGRPRGSRLSGGGDRIRWRRDAADDVGVGRDLRMISVILPAARWQSWQSVPGVTTISRSWRAASGSARGGVQFISCGYRVARNRIRPHVDPQLIDGCDEVGLLKVRCDGDVRGRHHAMPEFGSWCSSGSRRRSRRACRASRISMVAARVIRQEGAGARGPAARAWSTRTSDACGGGRGSRPQRRPAGADRRWRRRPARGRRRSDGITPAAAARSWPAAAGAAGSAPSFRRP